MDILGQSTVAYDNCSKIDKNPGLNLEYIQVPLCTLLYKSRKACSSQYNYTLHKPIFNPDPKYLPRFPNP